MVYRFDVLLNGQLHGRKQFLVAPHYGDTVCVDGKHYRVRGMRYTADGANGMVHQVDCESMEPETGSSSNLVDKRVDNRRGDGAAVMERAARTSTKPRKSDEPSLPEV